MSSDLQRLWRQLAADKRKLSLMVALLGFALLLWGRLLLKDVPRTANAVPGEAAAAAASAAENAGHASATDNGSAERPVMYVNLVGTVGRDLFRLDKRFYPDSQTDDQNTPSTAKLTGNPSDDSQQRRDAEAAMRSAAQNLVLNSTLLGTQPRAVINGVLLAPGESILGFTLIEVRSRAVTITRGDFEIVLEM